jgi:hypothetical protein
MNLIHRLRSRMRFCFVTCALVLAGALHAAPALAQSSYLSDDGNFSVYTSMSGSVSGISASSSSPTPDASLVYYGYNIFGPPAWNLSSSTYSISGTGSSFTTGPLPPGTYYVNFYWYVEYYFYGYPMGGSYSCDLCTAADSPVGWAMLTVQ